MVIKAGKDDENNQETLVLGGQWYMNLEAREAMMSHAPDLFRSYLKKIEEIQKELF